MAAAKSRPKTGPGSRTQLHERIKDEVDAVIFATFPKDVLEMPRSEFGAWCKANGIPKFDAEHRKRLAKHRRMMMARRYARESRARNIESASTYEGKISTLKAENKKLRGENKRLRKENQCLRAGPNQQIATDDYLSGLSSSSE